MAQMFSAMGTAMLMTMIVIGLMVTHSHDVTHADTNSRDQILEAGISLAIADLKSQVLASVQASNVVTGPPTTITNTFYPCQGDTTNPYCADPVTYTATLASNDISNTEQIAVLGASPRQNLNDNRGTDPNGNPVYNAATYRLHVALVMNGKEILNSDSDVQASILDSYPISVNVSTLRADNIAQTTTSVGYADTQCSSASLGCPNVTTAGDTTVPLAQDGCWDPHASTDPTLGNQCNPVGLASATPHPRNAIIQHAQNDGTNAATGTPP
jgi:hypothetical protein